MADNNIAEKSPLPGDEELVEDTKGQGVVSYTRDEERR